MGRRTLGELRALGITGPRSALRSVHNLARTVWDPTRADIRQGVNALAYGAISTASPDRAERLAAEVPALSRLWEERYDPRLDVEELIRLPEGTLGHRYARLIRDHGLDPLGDLLALGAPSNLLEYTFQRAYKLHDVMHVVLGCDVTVLGEVRVVSFSVGQARHDDERAAMIALSVLFLHLSLRDPGALREAVRLSDEWIELGARARPHVSFRLEDWMDRPVAEVRSRVLA